MPLHFEIQASSLTSPAFKQFAMSPQDFTVFKELFTGELTHMDLQRDTFASVMGRIQERMPWSRPVPNRREENHLHGLYLNALSDAIRQSRKSRADLVA